MKERWLWTVLGAVCVFAEFFVNRNPSLLPVLGFLFGALAGIAGAYDKMRRDGRNARP